MDQLIAEAPAAPALFTPDLAEVLFMATPLLVLAILIGVGITYIAKRGKHSTVDKTNSEEHQKQVHSDAL